MVFRKDEWVFQRIDGRYNSFLQSFLTSSLLFCDKNQSTLVDETPGERIYGAWVPFGGSEKGVQRKSLPVFAVSQVPSAQNNQYTKAPYSGVACPEFLHLSVLH